MDVGFCCACKRKMNAFKRVPFSLYFFENTSLFANSTSVKKKKSVCINFMFIVYDEFNMTF